MINLAASRTSEAPGQARWFGIRRIHLVEVRDELGRDARSAQHRDPDERRLYFNEGAGSSPGWLRFDELVALPEWLSVLRGEAELVAAEEVRTIDLPVAQSRTWQSVPEAPGLKVMLPRVDFADGHTSAEILTRVDAAPGETDPAAAGPPYVLRAAFVLRSGKELPVAGRAYGETLVDGGVLNSYSATAPQMFHEAAEPDSLELRLQVVTRQTAVTIPFAFHGVPVAAEPGAPSLVRNESSPHVAENRPGVRVQPRAECQGLTLQQMWVEAEADSRVTPEGVTTTRKVKVTAYIHDLLRERLYGAVPTLKMSEVRDEQGADLIALVSQPDDPNSSVRGYVRPRADTTTFNSGQLVWELNGLARLPRLLSVIKGRVVVMVEGPEKTVDIPIRDTADLVPLEAWPSMQASARLLPEGGGEMRVQVDCTRQLPPLPPLPSGKVDVRSRGPEEAGPPFLMRVGLVSAAGRIIAAKRPGESLGHAPPGTGLNSAVRSSAFVAGKRDPEAKVRLWIVDELSPLELPFEHRNVPVAALRRGG